LLIEEGITKQDIYAAMESQNINLREWSKHFFDLLNSNNIPLIILSAGWLWTLSIKRYLENQKSLLPNISLIWNEFIRNKNDVAINFKKPIIHTFNKDETVIKDFSEINQKVKNRKNVILLWDSISDIDMISWFKYDNLLKIWFLNKDIDKNLAGYKENFDVVITDDGSMEFVNKLLEEILKNIN
jgi:HAD superfamily hydrolase (TIGR01544 family)